MRKSQGPWAKTKWNLDIFLHSYTTPISDGERCKRIYLNGEIKVESFHWKRKHLQVSITGTTCYSMTTQKQKDAENDFDWQGLNTKVHNTLGKIVSRTCRARLEFQPEYPRRTISACHDKLNSLLIHHHKGISCIIRISFFCRLIF